MTVTQQLNNIEKKLDALNKRLFVDTDSLAQEIGRNTGRIDRLKLLISIPAIVLSVLSSIASIAAVLIAAIK